MHNFIILNKAKTEKLLIEKISMPVNSILYIQDYFVTFFDFSYKTKITENIIEDIFKFNILTTNYRKDFVLLTSVLDGKKVLVNLNLISHIEYSYCTEKEKSFSYIYFKNINNYYFEVSETLDEIMSKGNCLAS